MAAGYPKTSFRVFGNRENQAFREPVFGSIVREPAVLPQSQAMVRSNPNGPGMILKYRQDHVTRESFRLA